MNPLRRLRDTALETAFAVAERLRDPQEVARTAERAFAGAPAELLLPGWQPASLLLGHPGAVLLHTRCALDEERWAAVAHAHLAAAARVVATEGPAAAGGLLLPAWLHATRSGGYARLLARSAEAHAVFAEHAVRRFRARLATPALGWSYADYDAITGLAAQGRLLMVAADSGSERAAKALEELLECLVALTRPVRVGNRELPGWWCGPERYAVPHDRAAFPHGDVNLGVAHGIGGPLALLSLAHRAGHRVAGGPAAIREVVDWLTARQEEDEWGVHWPGRLAVAESGPQPSGGAASRSRAGWCYGTSGLAWALHLAGEALADGEVTAYARAAMRAALCRPPTADLRHDPGFCHGRAGLVQAGARMAADSGDPVLWERVDDLVRSLTADYREESAFGFRQHLGEAHGAPPPVDSPALLDGATGVALALASYADLRAGEQGEGTAWDAAFLMS